ncbi:hypothetical protein LguiB_006066 [Lonicera macranthoides]
MSTNEIALLFEQTIRVDLANVYGPNLVVRLDSGEIYETILEIYEMKYVNCAIGFHLISSMHYTRVFKEKIGDFGMGLQLLANMGLGLYFMVSFDEIILTKQELTRENKENIQLELSLLSRTSIYQIVRRALHHRQMAQTNAATQQQQNSSISNTSRYAIILDSFTENPLTNPGPFTLYMSLISDYRPCQNNLITIFSTRFA